MTTIACPAQMICAVLREPSKRRRYDSARDIPGLQGNDPVEAERMAQALIDLGLIARDHGRYTIIDWTIDKIVEHLALAGAIQALAAAQVASLHGKADFGHLEALNSALKNIDDLDPVNLLQGAYIDYQWHLELVRLSGNRAALAAYLIFAIADSRALYSAQALGTTIRAPSPSLYLANYPDSPAHTLMADMRETLDMSWTEHRRTVDRFAAFSALDDDAKASWLAWCMAKTLEASMGIDKKAGQSGPEPIDLHDHLAALMGITVASHWRPTAANYFDRVSKQTLLAHVSEVGGPTMAASFMGSKKGDLSASCEKLFAGETIVAPEVKEAALAWVPEAMRFRAISPSETDDEQAPIEAGGELAPEGEGDELEASEDQDAEAAEPVDA